MRRNGLVDAVDGLGRHDHLCWVFSTPAEFRRAAGRFLRDGLAAGQRVIYLAEAAGEDDLDDVDGFRAARAGGAAYVQDLGIYDTRLLTDPAAQVRAYAQATEQAVADGYAGLRVAADATPLVRTVSQREAFTRYEHLIDSYMTRRPFAAMCAYDGGRLSEHALAEIACMHPLARRDATPLRLFASEVSGVSAALAGEVDVSTHSLLHTALGRAEFTPTDNEVAIDARDLTYIDHRGLIGLASHFTSRGATLVLRVRQGSVAHLLTDLLCLSQVRVVVS